MKTHIMKLLANTFCAYAKARIGLEQISRQQGIGDCALFVIKPFTDDWGISRMGKITTLQ